MATEERILRTEFDALYSAISRETRIDCVWVVPQRIHPTSGDPFPSVRVSELSSSATQSLVRLLVRDAGLKLSSQEVESIALYSRGYPPAVLFAIAEVKTYGIAHVVSNQQALVNFSAHIFLKQLSEDKKITAKMADALQLLANYSPLPLSIVQTVTRVPSSEELAVLLSHLIDFAFVLPDGVHYRISEPIRDAAYRAFGGFRLNHALVADLLEAYLRETDDEEQKLALSQNLFRATLLSGQAESKYAVGLASDLVQLTTQSYHDQEYDNALKFGSRAVELRPDSANVRRYLAQVLIRKERYSDAERHIDALIERGHLGEAFYVKGFMFRRKHEYENAIRDYLRSIEYGRGGPAIHRELASCYFEKGDLAKAQAHIAIARKASPHNRFVVDLECTIAIRTGDAPAARKALAVLERVDPGAFYQHRMSTYEQAFGSSIEALAYSERAVESLPRPHFEVLANLANCQIEANQLAAASQIMVELQKRFAGTHHDAMVGLRCKLEIRKSEIQIAEALWNQIREKGTGVHAGLRLALLNRKSQIQPLTDAEISEQVALLDRFKDTDWKRNERLFGSVISSDE